jgi:hypothetical protein
VLDECERNSNKSQVKQGSTPKVEGKADECNKALDGRGLWMDYPFRYSPRTSAKAHLTDKPSVL